MHQLPSKDFTFVGRTIAVYLYDSGLRGLDLREAWQDAVSGLLCLMKARTPGNRAKEQQ